MEQGKDGLSSLRQPVLQWSKHRILIIFPETFICETTELK